MWIILAFISAFCLGCYDISKKEALRTHRVIDVLTGSVCISALILSVPLVLSFLCQEVMEGTLFYVPPMDLKGHMLTMIKSLIVLSSWVFAYVSLKQLPISVVSPLQATRPMWTLVGAMLVFGERLNGWQWTGVLIALGTVFLFSLYSRKTATLKVESQKQKAAGINPYYLYLALAILIGACSGLYDKFLMRHYDHNAVQVWYTFYQAVIMCFAWYFYNYDRKTLTLKPTSLSPSGKLVGSCLLISVFLVISDNVYMLALQDPDSLIAVVSTIRRGGAVIGFAYGLLFLKEKDPLPKILCMIGISIGLLCLAFG